MTSAEFQAFVTRWSAQRTVDARLRDVSDTFGWELRRVRSWYYGERPVPRHISDVIRPTTRTRRAASTMQMNATLALVASELARLESYVAAVEAMCRECEPQGECRNVECPLRHVSPLPIARRSAA